MKVFAMLLVLMSPCAFAALTQAEEIAASGGRIIGAALICKVDQKRLVDTGANAMSAIKKKAVSKRDYDRAFEIYIMASEVGAKQAKSGTVKCADAIKAFADIERMLQVHK